jgi:hypothetical protein
MMGVSPGSPTFSPVSQDPYTIHLYGLIKKRKIHTKFEKTHETGVKPYGLDNTIYCLIRVDLPLFWDDLIVVKVD